MIILAHRGLWKYYDEKNSVEAITKAIANGYGVETDIRDRSSELVISHDMPLDSAPRLRELSKIFSSSK